MASTDHSKKAIRAKGWAVNHAYGDFVEYEFERRALRPKDVLIRIHYCGICHSDIHEVNSDWTKSMYPLVPGHEITGYVEQIGSDVEKFRIGDPVGVGCMVDSCRQCTACQMDLEQHCLIGTSYTYNSKETDQTTPTYGGYSNCIVVTEHFVCTIPLNLPLDSAAPLLCAGTTTFSALRRCKVDRDSRVGVIGLGGLGHMAVKIAAAMGASVTVFALTEGQRADAHRLGAKEFYVSTDQEKLKSLQASFHVIIDTVPVPHDINALLKLLRFRGTLCMIGISPTAVDFLPANLIFNGLAICGTLISGLKETQEMLNFCGEHHITSDIELIQPSSDNIRSAYDRILKSDVKYRFVLDMRHAFK